MALKHAKTSGKADGGDATFVQPSDWNADHVISGLGVPVNKLLSADDTIAADTAVYIPDQLEIASGIKVTIASGGVLEIG